MDTLPADTTVDEVISSQSASPYVLNPQLEQYLNALVKQGITKINFVALLSGALAQSHAKLNAMLEIASVEPQTVVDNCQRILQNPVITKMGIFAFAKMIATLIQTNNLSRDTVSMNSQTDAINAILTAFEKHETAPTILDSDVELHDQNTDDESDENTSSIVTKKKLKEDKDKKMNVEYFGVDLTKESRDGFLDPVIGREKEINAIIYTLMRKTKNNPLLIGEAGVGKTAVVEGLAAKIASGNVPDKLKNKRIFLIDMGSLVAGTKFRGEFESRLKSIIEEAVDPLNNIILFIDEIHTIVGAGAGEGTGDAAQMLKPMLARGKMKLIGATTHDEYQKFIEKDAALKRRFQEVKVDEPTPAVTALILRGIKSKFEDFHGVKIEDEAIDRAIFLTGRYVLNKHFPDKAIDIIDEVCARKSSLDEVLEDDTDYKAHEDAIKSLEVKIEKAIEKQDYFGAATLKDEVETIKKEMTNLRSKKAMPMHLRPDVKAEDIGDVLSEKIGIPTSTLNSSDIQKLKALDSDLKAKILGQDDAVDAVVNALKRNRLSIIERNKPIASFLFLGASGTGKTYLAKLIAKDFFGDEKAMIRVDMSEFMEKHSVSKLIGSAPGYVGYEEGGKLTEAVRRNPYSVILLDEIEKASPDVLNILLQIMDEGFLKDAKGRIVDFKSTIIILTSNLGSEEFAKTKTTIGFAKKGSTDVDTGFDMTIVRERIMSHVKDFLSPELMNRLDGSIVFQPLSKAIMQGILQVKLNDFLHQWEAHNKVKVPSFSAEKLKEIVDEIYDPQYGARPIDKYIQDKIEPEIIEQVMQTSSV